MPKTSSKNVSGRTVAITFATFALSIFAILLWGRLKLVAGVPRTAYAEPNQLVPPPKVQPKAKPKPEASVPADRPDLQGD